MNWESDPAINEAFAELNRKRDAAAKRRADEIARRLPLLEKAKEQYDKDMAKAKGLGGESRRLAEIAIDQRYASKVAELSGEAAYRAAADARYRKIHGHNPDPEYSRREFSSAVPGGLGSPTAAIHDFVRSNAAEATEIVRESRVPEPSFTFDFRSGTKPYDRKATVSGKTVEHKTFPVLQTKIVNPQRGELETLFSVTGNVDRGADRIEAGAFEEVIRQIKSGAKPWPALLYGHQMDQLSAVMGSIIDLEELRPSDPRLPQRLQQNGWGAVKALARFNLKTSAGRDGFELASAGDLPSWSFAYVPGDYEFQGKGDSQVRSLRTIEELFECSLVVVPMNPEARTLTTAGMKSAVGELRVDRIEAAVLQRLATVFAGWKMARR